VKRRRGQRRMKCKIKMLNKYGMSRSIQFKIDTLMVPEEILFLATLKSGMFCVYGRVLGIPRYDDTFLLLDTGAEVNVCKQPSENGIFNVELRDADNNMHPFSDLYFINPPGNSTMFNNMALLGQPFLSMFDSIAFDLRLPVPRFIINAKPPSPFATQLETRRNTNTSKDKDTKTLVDNHHIVPLIELRLTLDPDCNCISSGSCPLKSRFWSVLDTGSAVTTFMEQKDLTLMNRAHTPGTEIELYDSKMVKFRRLKSCIGLGDQAVVATLQLPLTKYSEYSFLGTPTLVGRKLHIVNMQVLRNQHSTEAPQVYIEI
jgi:hypothetical protein